MTVSLTAPASHRAQQFGVRSVADVQTNADPWGFDGAQVEVEGCVAVLARASFPCPPDDEPVVEEVVRATATVAVNVATVGATGTSRTVQPQKVLNPTYGGVVESGPFSLYLLDGCKTIGQWGSAAERAQRVFTNAEDAAIDQAVITQINGGDGVEDLDVAGSLAEAIGALESDASNKGWGQPVLFLSRSDGPLAFRENLLVRVGDHLETQTGSLVALTPGKDSGAGGIFAFAVPWLILLQGAMDIYGPTVDTVTNDYIALVERLYLAVTPCVTRCAYTSPVFCCPVDGGGPA